MRTLAPRIYIEVAAKLQRNYCNPQADPASPSYGDLGSLKFRKQGSSEDRGCVLGVLRGPWRDLGGPWGVLGRSFGVLWGTLGVLWVSLGVLGGAWGSLGVPGASLKGLRGVLGVSLGDPWWCLQRENSIKLEKC